ncbi:MAG TPA: bifunctional DNA-formamidopyrimidine glycosylase/DNA-(apurinic or apyrimidinic site) lyase [Longimicrobiales bacterium]|nr:bifunctional DNA-formamidopyrimidine glycosylase/DNA-(apurinic or apyrimidinic site) lyase [Longimicrobiales bacterium]
MPELPEAETIVRGLRSRVVGRVVRDVDVIHGDVLRSSPGELRKRVRGRRIEAVDRRGKNVLIRLAEGRVVVVNLGMTGRLVPLEPGALPPDDATHPAVRLGFRDGGSLVFDDTRRFGTLECLDAAAWKRRSRALGPEPLDRRFTAARFHRALSRSRTPVRSWLLDQSRVAGVGNIYANEALYRAGVHPHRPARSVDAPEARRLHRALRAVLREAIRAGGTTIRDFRSAEGGPGVFVRQLSVYGREGEPCPRCRTPVERVVFANRSAFLCPRCQPDADRDGPRP